MTPFRSLLIVACDVRIPFADNLSAMDCSVSPLPMREFVISEKDFACIHLIIHMRIPMSILWRIRHA